MIVRPSDTQGNVSSAPHLCGHYWFVAVLLRVLVDVPLSAHDARVTVAVAADIP